MTQRVTATPEALETIERLKRKHGQLAFFQSGGCCDGSAAMCLTRGELLETDDDLKLGAIGGSPFYVDREQYERWGKPEFVIDVAPGEAGGFSLEGLEGIHFVSRSPVAHTLADSPT
jgi:Uncharacterized protein conserved in bacteria